MSQAPASFGGASPLPTDADLEAKLSEPAGLGSKTGLLLGAAEESLTIVAWETFLLFYYTQIVGLSGTLTGLAVAISLAIDAVLDPLIGSWSDSLRNAPLGRRHTLMVGALVPLAIASYFLFAVPAGLTQMAMFGWLTVFCIGLRAAMSCISVPLYAIGGELSRNPSERTVLLGLRTFGGGIGRLLAQFVAFTFFFAPTAAFPRGQFNPASYPAYGLFVGIGGAAMALACVFGTYRRIRSLERLEHRQPAHAAFTPLAFLKELIRAFRVTPNVRVAFLAGSTAYLIMALFTAFKLHLATYFWRISPAQMNRVFLAVGIGMLVSAVIAKWIVRRLDRRPSLMVGIVGFSIFNIISVAFPWLGLLGLPGSVLLADWVTILQFFSGVFFGLLVIAGGTITADVADEHEVNSGKPQQGLIQGVLFFGIKLASGLANLMGGIILDLIHFPIGAKPQDIPALTLDRLVMAVIAILIVAGASLIGFALLYDVSKEKQQRITHRLGIQKAGYGR
jgi:Na+/melibiose symporter-like transporter